MKPVTYEQAAEAVKFLADYVTQFSEQAQKEKLTVTTAVRLMDDLRRLKDLLKEQAGTPLELIYNRMMFGIVPDIMTDAELTTVGVEDVGKCRVQDEITASAIPEKKAELYDWLVDNEFEDMITKSVNAQTLAAFVRRRMKENAPLPTECLNIKPVTKAIITRG